MSAFPIEEGEVIVNGESLEQAYVNLSNFHINTDKVIAFFFHDGKCGKESDAVIITEGRTFKIEGYGGNGDDRHGLGYYICTILEQYLNEPVGIKFRGDEDAKVFDYEQPAIVANCYNCG